MKYLILLFAYFAPIQFIQATHEPLVVCYATTHLNKLEESIVGVLVSPSGEITKTRPLLPYDQVNLLIESPEDGSYKAYFEAIKSATARSCHFLGGIVVVKPENPHETVTLSPKDSRIHSFPPSKQILPGQISHPVTKIRIKSSS